ncbi:MAG: acyltransferase [Bacteroidota bacterium]
MKATETKTELAEQKNRLAWIDYAKGMAILMVVYRHLLIGLGRSGLDTPAVLMKAADIVLTVRMPLFFVLSGFFIGRSLQKRSNLQFIRNKFDTLLYPYLIWAAIQVSLQIFFSSYINADRTGMDYLYILIKPRAIDHFWFIYALFNVSVFYLFISRVLKGNKMGMLIIGIIFRIAFVYLHQIPVLNDILRYFFFLAVGDVVASFILKSENQEKMSSYKFTLLVLVIFSVAQWFWLDKIYVTNGVISEEAGYEHNELNTFILTVLPLVGSILIFSISFILAKHNLMKFFSVAGYYSLYIYLLHAMVGAASRVALVKFLGITNVPLLLAIEIVIATAIPIIFYKLINRIGLYFLFSPNKPKRA